MFEPLSSYKSPLFLLVVVDQKDARANPISEAPAEKAQTPFSSTEGEPNGYEFRFPEELNECRKV